MKKRYLTKMKKEELVSVNGGSNPFFGIANFFDQLEAARRKTEELKSIR